MIHTRYLFLISHLHTTDMSTPPLSSYRTMRPNTSKKKCENHFISRRMAPFAIHTPTGAHSRRCCRSVITPGCQDNLKGHSRPTLTLATIINLSKRQSVSFPHRGVALVLFRSALGPPSDSPRSEDINGTVTIAFIIPDITNNMAMGDGVESEGRLCIGWRHFELLFSSASSTFRQPLLWVVTVTHTFCCASTGSTAVLSISCVESQRADKRPSLKF